MGRLDRLFGNTKAIVKEAVLDEQKCIDSFGKLLAEFKQKQDLVRIFARDRAEAALQDWSNVLSVLQKIESLIPQELVSIGEEEKLEDEILRDLTSLKDVSEIRKLSNIIAHKKRFKAALFTLFSQIHRVLVIELHLIRHIRKKPNNVKLFLIKLFEAVFYTEDALYEVFMKENHEEEEIYQEVLGLAHAVLLEKEINDLELSDEEEFAAKIHDKMGDAESRHEYRKLGENIFHKLAEMASELLDEEEDILERIGMMDKLVKDDNILHEIIRKLKRKYNEVMINAAMMAFRRSYSMGDFIDLESDI